MNSTIVIVLNLIYLSIILLYLILNVIVWKFHYTQKKNKHKNIGKVIKKPSLFGILNNNLYSN